MPSRRRICAAAFATALGMAPFSGAIAGQLDADHCAALAPLNNEGAPLALRPATDVKPLSILAIGSSSTEGVGASSPNLGYPAQLARDLAVEFKINAEVVNAGVGGETVSQTLARLKAALRARSFDLVIWQVGTNDALNGRDERNFRARLDEGLAEAAAKKTPIVLIDPQLTPSRLHDDHYARYAQVIGGEGARFHVPVLSRYEMMKSLATENPDGWKAMLSQDGVHMNDLGYACIAHSLARPIAEAAGAGGLATH